MIRCLWIGMILILGLPGAGRAAERPPLDAAADLGSRGREALLLRLHLPPDTVGQLATALARRDLHAFDATLLAYCRSRESTGFFFTPDHVEQNLAFIRAHLGGQDIIHRADLIMLNRFPSQDGASEHIVEVPDDIDWHRTDYSANPETIHTLNRHRHWIYLALAYRMTGRPEYGQKVVSQLIDWAGQNPPLDDPETWRRTLPHWWLMDAAVRADTWIWTYSLLIDTDVWTPETNTLFLYKLYQHGKFLAVVTPQDIRTNHALVHGQGLLMLGRFFPEFADSERWQRDGRELLFRAMDAQTFDDGCNGEQSPNYAVVVVTRLLEMLWLDERAGEPWPAERMASLERAVESYYQLLSPNGTNPALSDSYRTGAATLFLEANLVFGTNRWPAARPRQRDVWLFGPDHVMPFLWYPANPVPTDRGRTCAMTESGNYVMRSGSDPDARQLIFDAGPKGGLHGHFDLLNIEFFGYGRPLVADPGLLRYDASADREWVRSTPAHNTISVDGYNHGALEGAGNPGIVVDQWHVADDHVQVAAHHFGYGHLIGRPVVARSVWYDLNDTMLIVDWGESVEEHDFTSSFTIPGTACTADLDRGQFRSTDPAARGNIDVQFVRMPGQRVALQSTFTSSQPPPREKDEARRFTISQRGRFACFVTLVTSYPGLSPPATSAELLTAPVTPGGPVVVRLTRGGGSRDITFTPPVLQRPDDRATVNATHADLAFGPDGRLHLAYFDPGSGNLKYTVREVAGRWSIVETIDAGTDCGHSPSLAIDSSGKVGIAYTDAAQADLKFALHDGDAWQVETVDAKGSTGHYPSLAFSRRDGAAITYYDRTRGDLRMAGMVTSGWHLQTIDDGGGGGVSGDSGGSGGGDRGDVGRFSRLALDPARPYGSKWVIVYEDTTARRYRCAVQGELRGGERKGDYTVFEVITSVRKLGGFTSLAFDAEHRPTVVLYDALRDAVQFSASSGSSLTGIRFDHVPIARGVGGGDSTSLLFDPAGRPCVFYRNGTSNTAMFARQGGAGDGWEHAPLCSGGGQLHVARLGDTLAFTTRNPATGTLHVEVRR